MKISIITVNYNNGEGLRTTIEQVAAQTFKDIEYIIIDGGSTDDSVGVIRQWEASINYWVSEKDRGIYHAMNKGIAQATGDYLIFINSGDYFATPTVVAEAAPLLEKDIVYGAADWRADNRSELHVFPEKITLAYLYRASLPHQSTFIHKSVFDKTGPYTEKFRIASDWEIWVKAIFLYRCTYKRIPITVSVFDATGISNTKKGKEYLAAEKEEVFSRDFPGIHEDYLYFHNIIRFFYTNWVMKLLRKLRIIRLDKVLRNAAEGY